MRMLQWLFAHAQQFMTDQGQDGVQGPRLRAKARAKGRVAEAGVPAEERVQKGAKARGEVASKPNSYFDAAKAAPFAEPEVCSAGSGAMAPSGPSQGDDGDGSPSGPS